MTQPHDGGRGGRSELIDISAPLHPGMATWPESRGYRHTWVQRLAEGATSNASSIDLDVHCGTHVDAPLHHLDAGTAVDQLALEPFVGRAYVADLGDAPEASAAVLRDVVPPGAERVLLRTANSQFWPGLGEFRADFVALTLDGARWLVDSGIVLVANDYLSVQRFGDSSDTHTVMLGAGVAVVEGVCLAGVDAGWYQLVCLPLALVGAEASPARAILIGPEEGGAP